MSAFVIADTHFGHAKILHFVDEWGIPIRQGFASLEHMHEEMIKRWNEKVHARDTVYHLGDVAIPRSGLQILKRLNGRKILIRGNHDTFKLKDYAAHFDDIRGCHYKDGLVFSHIPIHRDSFHGSYRGNVHGHLHGRRVMHEGKRDSYYFNACVELNNYTPVAWEDIQQYFSKGDDGAQDVQHAS